MHIWQNFKKKRRDLIPPSLPFLLRETHTEVNPSAAVLPSFRSSLDQAFFRRRYNLRRSAHQRVEPSALPVSFSRVASVHPRWVSAGETYTAAAVPSLPAPSESFSGDVLPPT